VSPLTSWARARGKLSALVAIAAAALTTTTGAAEEPAGFAGLPWGSSAAKVRDSLKPRCQFSDPADGFKQVCPGYRIADIQGKLTLLFVPGYGLSGWDFACPADKAGNLTSQITQRFGRAAQEGANRAYWHWAWGSAALFKVECSVSVATNRALDYMRQIDQERAKREKKDF